GHGGHAPESVRAAPDTGVGFIGLVASMVRGRAGLDELALSDEERHRVHSPVGLAIGARTAEEIALAILADLVKAVRVDGLKAPEAAIERPLTTIDPVCGMTVTVVADTPHLANDGVDYWFCNPGCRTRYIEELAS
ncbi:MAG: carbon monoxide dehydrogenase accessory protein, partial [Actinomycetia bacterium]|nr:carbon monoxide dehydrogenase accessory protein [Actinomycetes bacterium]